MKQDVIAPWAEIVPGVPYPMTIAQMQALPEDNWQYELVDGRLVWIIWPDTEHVDVWRPGSDASVATLTTADQLDGPPVSPIPSPICSASNVTRKRRHA